MAIVPDFYKFLLEKKEKENEQTSIPDGYEKKKISELKFTDSFDVFNDMDIDDVIKKINLYSSNDIRDSKNRPVKYFILIIEIIFRFIPLLIEEATSILKTQSIRGGLGKVSGTMGKIKAIIPLIVPLIIQTIKRSENLADAITMRKF